ncbi:hypothetical protein [Dyella kyungheensis]|uniref:Transmembrane protein n=1 Tax=Dyella kyungheensis TaxID=1242174 RepID=A0ABS2JP19_9GAMM|nr:hypothetical protein [Dyella kyungheensis]MBM7120789.1 hypothetical protein [Dyella kyungheensis]
MNAVPSRSPLRLSARRRRFCYGVGLGLWLSGAGWLLFHYGLQQQGSFGPQPHPLEIWWLRVHGAFAFATLWAFGMTWSAHIVGGWQTLRQRWSGGAGVGMLLVQILSGYLIYYLVDDAWHDKVALMHWMIGLTLPAVIATHIVRGRRPRR